jgi:hypothetical protein
MLAIPKAQNTFSSIYLPLKMMALRYETSGFDNRATLLHIPEEPNSELNRCEKKKNSKRLVFNKSTLHGYRSKKNMFFCMVYTHLAGIVSGIPLFN